jgi:hypothetical protein
MGLWLDVRSGEKVGKEFSRTMIFRWDCRKVDAGCMLA